MENATIALAGTLIIFLVLCAGVIILQIFLSKKENKWAGLILPGISLFISLLGVMGIVLFSAHTGTQVTTVDGEIIEQAVNVFSPAAAIIGSAAYAFLLFNIPTVILIAIYTACRGKQKRQRDLEKMSVQDLE
jgi:glucan phosphoethanolaminetransferase (alkaline phosphatase superfamily)